MGRGRTGKNREAMKVIMTNKYWKADGDLLGQAMRDNWG